MGRYDYLEHQSREGDGDKGMGRERWSDGEKEVREMRRMERR